MTNIIRLYDVVQMYAPDELTIDKKARFIWKHIVSIFEKQFTYTTHWERYPKCFIKVLKFWLSLTEQDLTSTDGNVLSLREYGRSKKGYGRFEPILTYSDGTTSSPILVSWQEFLGYRLDPQQFSNEELIAYNLKELTFHGFKPHSNPNLTKELNAKGDRIQQDYRNGTLNFVRSTPESFKAALERIRSEPGYDERQQKALEKKRRLKVVKIAYHESVYEDDSVISDFSESESDESGSESDDVWEQLE